MNTDYKKQIDELISKMTLKEKIGQLNMIVTPQTEEEFEKVKQKIIKGEIGSMILADSATAGNDQQAAVDISICNRIQEVATKQGPHGIPMIFGRDVIHGHRTVYPVPLAMAASFNQELIKKAYRNIAEEAAADSIHWTFTPMLDMCRDPRYGRIIEGPGEDPLVGKRMARAIVEGFQNGNVANEDSLITCPKHFVGYGASEGGRDYYRTEISPYTLFNYHLPAFREAIDAGADTVMSSFNDINGEPVSGSKYYLTEILRNYLGFKGLVVSDWAAVYFLALQGVTANRKESAEMGINAGIEIDMCDGCYLNNLEELIEEGRVTEETLNNAVRLVLELKFKKNLFKNPYCKMPEVEREEHIRCAYELASESMVLLKNNGVLPLKKEQKVALLGPLTYERRALLGSWCIDGKPEETASFYEKMFEKIGDNLLVASDTTGLYDTSAFVMYKSDVVVLALGESHLVTGERRSLSDITLSAAQKELVRKAKCSGKKVVGVIFCGRPIAMEGLAEDLDAILYAWHSGTETSAAVTDILFGDIVPSGKTAITFPRQVGHIPLYYNTTKTRFNCYYNDSPQMSYEDSIPTPYYPFGYGLSFTKFEYSDIKSETNEISLDDLKLGKKLKYSVKVSNIGDYDAKETVQLYIRDLVGTLMRPYRELKDYKKIFIAKNDSKDIQFEIGYEDLGYYLPDGSYIVEKGEFEIFIGENCLTANKFNLKVI